MARVTRRTFLARTGVAAAVAATAAASGLGDLTASAAPAVAAKSKRRGTARRGDALVAHVRNIGSGEVAILMGTREAVIRDRGLVARLVAAVR